jgi:UDP-N-acetylglucosamine:LPS N-acetylglucosamine transferase
VQGFTETLSDLFNAGDLLVTKAGGLTTFQAVARRLPMAINLLTEPMPQEMGTVDILLKAGLAQVVRKNDDIIAIIDGLKPVQDRQLQPLPKMHNLDRVDAVYEIAQTILDLDKCPQPVT